MASIRIKVKIKIEFRSVSASGLGGSWVGLVLGFMLGSGFGLGCSSVRTRVRFLVSGSLRTRVW